MPPTVATSNVRIPWRVVSSCAVGSIFEYYDFFVYGPLAVLVLPRLFFPEASASTNVLLAMGTFVVGFAARPVGGIVFGHWGDRLGRKPMLIATFAITGLSTFALGFLPTYAQIGIAAPILLTALRVVQGFGLGGEWSGAALLAAEHSAGGARGFAGSLIQAGAPIGVITATVAVTAVSAALGDEGLLAWGWRLPFMASLVLVAVGLALRVTVDESPEFLAMRARADVCSLPIAEALRRAPGRILGAVAIHSADVTIGIIVGIFVLGYATNVLHFSPTIVLLAVISGSLANLIVTPLVGRWCDLSGTTVALFTACAMMALWAFPMFFVMHRFGVAGVFCAIVVGQIITSMIFSPLVAYFRELFEPEIRYTASSLGFQIATILGASSPLIAQSLQNASAGATWPISTYMVIVAAIAAISVLAMHRVVMPRRSMQAEPTRS
ncbi:MAG: MFS transporter [Candidatus Tyrphobacter sp.]